MGVVSLTELANVLASERERGAGVRVVLACGCFDPLHVGHVRHFRESRKFGDLLIVLVTADRFVAKAGRPVVSEEDRLEVVAACRYVDYAILNPYPTATEAIILLEPDVYTKGQDSHIPLAEECAVRVSGGRVEYTDTEAVHSTDLLRKLAACGPVGGAWDDDTEGQESD